MADERTGDTNIEQDVAWERKWHRFEQIMWTLMVLLLIAACVGIYLFVQPTVPQPGTTQTQSELNKIDFTVRHAAIPCELTQGRQLTVVEVRETFINGQTEFCQSAPGGPALAPAIGAYADPHAP